MPISECVVYRYLPILLFLNSLGGLLLLHLLLEPLLLDLLILSLSLLFAQVFSIARIKVWFSRLTRPMVPIGATSRSGRSCRHCLSMWST